MAIKIAGSSSTGDRRRRRIVANGDSAGIDSSLIDGDGSEIESELVASAAAGPWVPATESKIWIYGGLIGAFLGGLTFAWTNPGLFHAELSPLTTALLTGSSPILITITEVLFLVLSAQLGHLIGWYRSRGKLDFGGRYRFWPWATGLMAIAALGIATNFHRPMGEIIEKTELLTWRGATVAWLLPICVACLPIALFLDRDIRHSRSSLWTLRISSALWTTEAWFEVFRPELQSKPWFETAFTLIPLFASATMFVGLWLHARIVAYVCPDPPELDEQSAWATLLGAFSYVVGLLMFWKKSADDTKTKRRRKKAEPEEAAAKPKRKTTKRTTSRPRTRTKPAVEESVEESENESADDEAEATSDSEDTTSSVNRGQRAGNQWEEDQSEEAPVTQQIDSRSKGRITQVHKAHNSSVPAPHAWKQSSSWDEESEEKATAPVSSDESSDDSDDEYPSTSGADPLKGLSKRQKREMKRQLREQERSRGR